MRKQILKRGKFIMLEQFFKSILEQDKAPVVVCDMQSTVVYMNPAAIARYHCDLTGKSVKSCHPAAANEKIDRVLQWFEKSSENTMVYTYRNDKENKDVYMVALRSADGTLIGYYEKHEYRNRETGKLYDI
jgi:PAS domain-containing protein